MWVAEYKVKSIACKPRIRRAFTLIELMVAIGILAMVLSFAGVIFRVSIDSHRIAVANAEIMQKLRTITTQLDSDFQGLRKDGEILVAWVARQRPNTNPSDPNAYERFDRIMFFADGDFQSYKAVPLIRGNVARICYMLAKKDDIAPTLQAPEKRILARTQHILTADPNLADSLDPNSSDDQDWYLWNNWYEYDKVSLEQWKTEFPWEQKAQMLSVITDIKIDRFLVEDNRLIGATIDPANLNSIHILLCEGVGQFKVQGWYQAQQRWLPEIDPNGDGNLADTDFIMAPTGDMIDPETVPGLLYPYLPNGVINIRNISYPVQSLDEAHFALIPGLGRALKFTFTLYDSKGIIKNGRTFTHIVYLDN